LTQGSASWGKQPVTRSQVILIVLFFCLWCLNNSLQNDRTEKMCKDIQSSQQATLIASGRIEAKLETLIPLLRDEKGQVPK